MSIEERISTQLNWDKKAVANVLKLKAEGATIPFISRYRKEASAGMDEVMVEKTWKAYEALLWLQERKAHIAKQLEEASQLTDKLRAELNQCETKAELEDLYLPYKKQRKTKADEAIEKGLMPVTKRILAGENTDLDLLFANAANKHYPTQEKVKEGVEYIIAKWTNENIWLRTQLRKSLWRNGKLIASKKRGVEEVDERFEKFTAYSESIKRVPPHRFLALKKGEGEGYLSLKIEIEKNDLEHELGKLPMKLNHPHADFVNAARLKGVKRLLLPSLENECLADLKTKSDEASVPIFRSNLEQLLMSPPLGNKRVMGIDPGFRTGCKLVCIDENGELLHNETIYPHAPKNEQLQAKKKIKTLTESHNIDAIAIGNGTAGRETENLLKAIRFNRDLAVFVVDEAGASVYSASKIAREEFPQFDVTVRGAVSIARRLQDPLAELVKITPESLGIGQYQHEVDQSLLKEALTQTVENTVNKIGVNINLASKHLLKYLSGIGDKTAEQIVQYRVENGAFKTKKDLLNVPGLGAKAFEQAAGFIRIPNGKHPLDNTGVHPEAYPKLEKLAKAKKFRLSEIVGNKDVLQKFFSEDVEKELGAFTAKLVLEELKKPGRDPRKASTDFQFSPKLKSLADVEVDMILPGMVTNLTHFGAFVDIGIKENGLIHKSQIADEFVDNPADYLKLHQKLKVKVVSVEKEKKRIGLSLKF